MTWPVPKETRDGILSLRDLVVQGEQLLERLAADVDLERLVDVRIEVGAEVPGRLLQREVKAEQRPRGLLEVATFCRYSGGNCSTPTMLRKVCGTSTVLATNCERIRVPSASSTPRAWLPSTMIRVDVRAGAKSPPAAMKVSISAAGERDAAADRDLVVRDEVEAAHQRAHRAAGGDLVVEDGAEQRDLEQQQQPDPFVLEQLVDRVSGWRLMISRKSRPTALRPSSSSRSASASGSE